MTKEIAVEGTAILAREFADRLESSGIGRSSIDEAQKLSDRLSIVDEARIASRVKGVSSMHDVTEGGLATAIAEIARSVSIRVDRKTIPIHPLTRRFSEVLGFEPLGLIGSGSLLITCSPEAKDELLLEIRRAGIMITEIGTVTSAERRGAEWTDGSKALPAPSFSIDEIARLLSG